MVWTKQYKELQALLPDTKSQEYAKELKRHWRRLSLKYHPDKGGSNEDMQALNAARDQLDVEESPTPSPKQTPVPSQNSESPAPTQTSNPTQSPTPSQNSDAAQTPVHSQNSDSESGSTSPTPKFRDHFRQRFRPRPPPHFKVPSPPHPWVPKWEADGRKTMRSDTSFPEERKYHRKGGPGRKEQWIDPEQYNADVHDHVHRREQDDWTQAAPPVVEQTLPPDGPIIDARDPRTYKSNKRKDTTDDTGSRRKRRKQKPRKTDESVEAKMRRTSAMFD